LRFDAADAVDVLRVRRAPQVFWAGQRVCVEEAE